MFIDYDEMHAGISKNHPIRYFERFLITSIDFFGCVSVGLCSINTFFVYDNINMLDIIQTKHIRQNKSEVGSDMLLV